MDGHEVLLVTEDNAATGIRRVAQAVASATFVSLAVATAADPPQLATLASSSLVELGITTFRRRPPKPGAAQSAPHRAPPHAHYSVRLFKILLLRADAPVSLPSARRLARRGVAIQAAFLSGIQYTPPGARAETPPERRAHSEDPGASMRGASLYRTLSRSTEPPENSMQSDGWGRLVPQALAKGQGAELFRILVDATVPLVMFASLPHILALCNALYAPVFYGARENALADLAALLPKLLDLKVIAQDAQMADCSLDEIYHHFKHAAVEQPADPTQSHQDQTSRVDPTLPNSPPPTPPQEPEILHPDIEEDDKAALDLLQSRIEGILEDSFDSPLNSTHSGKVFEPMFRHSASQDLSRSLRQRFQKVFDERRTGSSKVQVEPAVLPGGDASEASSSHGAPQDFPESNSGGTARESFMIASILATFGEQMGWDSLLKNFEGSVWDAEDPKQPIIRLPLLLDRKTTTSKPSASVVLDNPTPDSIAGDLRQRFIGRLGVGDTALPVLDRQQMLGKATKKVDNLLQIVVPSTRTLKARLAVFDEVSRIVKRVLSAQSFLSGSSAMRTFVLGSTVEISVFMVPSKDAGPEDWMLKLMSAICEESCRATLATQSNNNAKPEFGAFSNISCSKDGPAVIATIRNLELRITANNVDASNEICFIEEIDGLIGEKHFFKRSATLINAWIMYSGTIGKQHKVFPVPASGILTMLLFIFNTFSQNAKSPLEIFHHFLQFYTSIDWDTHGISIYGPVQLSSGNVLCQEAPQNRILSGSFIAEYARRVNETKQDNTKDWSAPQASAVTTRPMVVFNPLDGSRNQCESVRRGDMEVISDVFVRGLKNLELYISAPSTANLVGVFGNTLSIHLEDLRHHDNALAESFEQGLSRTSSGLGQSDSGGLTAEDDSLDPLSVEVTELRNQQEHLRFVCHGIVSEHGLLDFLSQILEDNGGLLIGEIGQHLRATFGRQDWSAILRERFGGLKKFLLKHDDVFYVGSDHALNPHVYLVRDSVRANPNTATISCRKEKTRKPARPPRDAPQTT